MRSLYSYFCSLLLVVGSILGCEEILENDISRKELHLIAPTEGAVLENGDVRFSWEPVGGANGYLLQLATPNFIQAQQVVVDTFIGGTFFDATLPPGTYEWRVSAENSAYYTPFASSTFSIDAESFQAPLTLTSPESESALNTSDVLFQWQPYQHASYYILTIIGDETQHFVTTQTSLSVPLPKDGSYSWHVNAINESSGQNVKSAGRQFSLDRTPPSVPAYLKPLTASVVQANAAQIEIDWEDVEEEDFDHYNFYLFRDNGGNWEPVHSAESLYESGYMLHPFEGAAFQVGTYLWKIRTVDRLGNISPVLEEGFSFTVE